MKDILTYYSDKRNDANRVTVVGKFCDDNTLCMSYARCSDKDKFHGTIGANIALGRMNKQKHCVSIPIEDVSIDTFKQKASELAVIVKKFKKYK